MNENLFKKQTLIEKCALTTTCIRDYASLSKKVTLIGQGEKFEIWDQNFWNENVDKWREEATSNDDAEALKDISI